jgi:hypothetical protein
MYNMNEVKCMKKRSSVRLLRSLAAGSTLLDRGRAGRYADVALGESVLDLVDKIGKLLSDKGISAHNGESVKHVLLLGALILSEDLKVFMRGIETFTLNSTDVVKFSVSGSGDSVNLLVSIAEISVDILVDLGGFIVAPLSEVALIADFHQLAGSSIEVGLHLLQFTSLSEEVLGGSSALVFEDLLAVKVGTFSSLHELISVVLVPKLEMVEGVDQGLELFLTLADLAIELVTITLEFFLLLSGLDNVVSLGVLSGGVNFSGAGGVLLDEALVFDAQVLDATLAVLKLNGHLMALFFSSLEL